jgi:pyruvate dehydrogenase E1 component alpha subunit
MTGLPVPYSREESLELVRHMLRIRRFEEKCAELYGQQKIRGFLHLYIGEEAVAAGAIPTLASDDALVCTYREHGHALVRGVPMNALMAEMYGKVQGCSRGRGGSMHVFDVARRLYGGNAIVGGGIPMAVGLALAERMQKKRRVTACFFGEGAMAEGVFYESLNLAALWELPALFLCENNLYAMGTSLGRSESQTDLARKAASFNVATETVDGMDVVAVRESTKKAVAHVRERQRPMFIEFQTYRFRAHSMFDAELYRDKAEVEEWKKRGPLHTFTDRLKAQRLMSEEDFLRLDQDANEEVKAAVVFAEQGSWEPVEDLTRDLYAPEAER